MKTLKTVTLVVLLALSGCKESSDALLGAHAKSLDNGSRAEYYSAYSGANIPNTAARGQVYEYH
jgi:hypothetical protein